MTGYFFYTTCTVAVLLWISLVITVWYDAFVSKLHPAVLAVLSALAIFSAGLVVIARTDPALTVDKKKKDEEDNTSNTQAALDFPPGPLRLRLPPGEQQHSLRRRHVIDF